MQKHSLKTDPQSWTWIVYTLIRLQALFPCVHPDQNGGGWDQMGWLVGTLIALAIIYFMIVSPGFRAFAIVLIIISGIGIFIIIENGQKQTKERQAQQATTERLSLTSIRADELSLTGVSLTKEQYGGWVLQGTLTNNSKFNLGGLRFQVTMHDCFQTCKIIGQETTMTVGSPSYDPKPLVPASQIRLFKTYSMKFENMPPASDPRWEYKITEIRAVF